MNTKNCPICNEEINGEALDSCPSCGAGLSGEDVIPEAEEIAVQLAAEGEEAQPEAEGEEAQPEEAEAPSVKIKTAAACLAVILAISLLAFCWHMYSKYKFVSLRTYTYVAANRAKDLEKKDIQGVFSDYVSGMYFNFIPGRIKVDVPDASQADLASDSSAASDAEAAAPVKTVTKTFDGSLESGFTDDYVQRVLANIYISENGLTEEYGHYLDEKKSVLDDYLGFIDAKNIDRKKLDEIDKAQGISEQGMSYDQNGYWNYDDKTNEIIIFDDKGMEMAALMIAGDAIVDPTGYLRGDIYTDSLFDGSYTFSQDGYTETVNIYRDGNYIVTSRYEGGDPQQFTGSYKSDPTHLVLEAQGQKMTYTKIKGGISFITYKKQ